MTSSAVIKPALRVAIVGAGIGGLSLALALRERGVRADVFEQAGKLTEIGAAIGLAGNGIREFARLGLLDELAAAFTVPTELIYRHWQDGSRIAAHPVAQDDWYVKQFGVPWFGIHRADLQTTLSRALGGQNLHLGCRLVNIVEQRSEVVLEFANGRTHHADVVVGADGVRSTVRRWVTGADDALYSGTSAFRGIVPVGNLPSLPDPHAIQFWMGPDGHLLHYAIGGGGEAVNFFAVVEGPGMWLPAGSVTEVQDDVPVGSFRGWHPAVTEMIRAASSPIRWGLFTVRPLLHWYRGRAVILGDAAHGMLPHHGQGRTPPSRTPSCSAPCWRRPALMTWPPRSPGTRRCAGPGPARSSAARGSPAPCCTCPTGRPRRPATGRWPGCPRSSAGSTPTTLSRRWPGPARAGPGLPARRTSGTLMPADEVLAGVAEILGSVTGVDRADITPATSLSGDLGLDSLLMVEIVVAAEDRFGLLIDDDDWPRFKTVLDAARYIEQAAAGF